jgi:hypothetical protein
MMWLRMHSCVQLLAPLRVLSAVTTRLMASGNNMLRVPSVAVVVVVRGVLLEVQQARPDL